MHKTILIKSIVLLFTDIDECLTNNGECDQVCINIEGSYRCTCHQGYSYNDDSGNCVG